MRLHCEIGQLHTAVRALHDVWKDQHADGDGAIGLTCEGGSSTLIVRAASMRSYGQYVIDLTEPASENVDLVLDASMLSSLLKMLDSAQILIDGKVVTLRQGDAERQYQINSLTEIVAPRPHDIPAADRLFDVDALRPVGDALTMCTSSSDMRSALGGVLWEWQDGELHLVSTDSYRLVHARLALLQEAEEASIISPVRAFEWMLKTTRLLKVAAASIGFSERWLVIQVGRAEYVCAPQAGRFPPWREIMPVVPDDAMRATFERDDALSAMQRLQPFTGPADHVIWSTSGESLRISAADSVLGNAHEILKPIGGKVDLGDNTAYTAGLIISALGKLHSDQVVIMWPKAERGPLVAHFFDGHVEYLQMPLHTGTI